MMRSFAAAPIYRDYTHTRKTRSLFARTMMGLGALATCMMTSSPHSHAANAFKHDAFGTLSSGQKVQRYTLRNAHGMSVQFLSYGGIIPAITVPDRNGHPANVVLGFPTLEGYETDSAHANIYFGALIGRYANRLANGTFPLDGQTIHTTVNNPPNTLHGGLNGFDKKVWHVRQLSGLPHAVGAELTLTSPDGEEGFPGTLHTTVDYILDDSNRLSIRYRATTDRPTVVNLTNHSYFNLAGEGAGSIENHTLQINADSFTPVDHTAIPTGQIASVSNTPLDFRTPHRIGDHLRSNHPQMLIGRGYDHNWIVNGYDGKTQRLAATVTDPVSGRTLSVFTTQPGIQVYTSNSLDGTYAGPSGHAYRQTDAIALETQHYPDSPNHPAFPTTALRPGEQFDHTTSFQFGIAGTSTTP